MYNPIRRLSFYSVLIVILLVTLAPANNALAQTSGYDWLQWNGNPQHSGNNTQETLINTANIKTLKQIYQVTLPAVVDGAPVYLRAVKTPTGVRDLLFVTTRVGHIMALDAATGLLVWMQKHTNDSCAINKDLATNGSCYTSSIPAIDPNLQYIYSYGLDGFVHKHQVGDGVEITSGGWPQVVTLKPWVERAATALSIATAKSGISYLYVTKDGYNIPYPNDPGDYQGHVTIINLGDGTQKVFNVVCSNLSVHLAEKPKRPACNQESSGIWGRGGVVYNPDTDKIYVTTGLGRFSPGNYAWSDSVLAFKPDGTGLYRGPIDSYTPTDYRELIDKNQSLGSSAPLILPVPATSKIKNLAVQIGQDRKLRLINMDDLSGKGKPGYVGGEVGEVETLPYDANIDDSPALWVDPDDNSAWVYMPTYDGISGFQLTFDSDGMPKLNLMWKNTNPCKTPLVANDIIYCAGFKNIWAFDPLDGKWLWGDYPIGDIHWQTPIVVNGVLYITDEAKILHAYALLQSF
ncbi:MAG: hypothetical protein ABI947_00030 [Chloroflexota bacterium]